MKFKSIVYTMLVGTIAAVGCNSNNEKEGNEHNSEMTDSSGSESAELNEMRTGNGPGTGTGTNSGTGTGTPGTGTGPGAAGTANHETGPLPQNIPTGTGTVSDTSGVKKTGLASKNMDTIPQRAKWPYQGDPFH